MKKDAENKAEQEEEKYYVSAEDMLILKQAKLLNINGNAPL
jgi:hypothetical protein